MHPLIKWPGGKSSEIRHLLPLIPEYDRYIEPFAGGAALYFHLDPERALLNDISGNLIEFYRMVQTQDEDFGRYLHLYADLFDAIRSVCSDAYDRIHTLYRLYEYADDQKLDLRRLGVHRELACELADEVLTRVRSGKDGRQACRPEDLAALIPDEEGYRREMEDSLGDKLVRTAVNSRRKPFSEEDLYANLLTGLMGGFYLYARSLYNEIALGKRDAAPALRAANFYFVREYCYGSMFRYNRAGEFNIPYGGCSYNNKDFRSKIDYLSDPQVCALLQRTQLYCADFETFTENIELGERDFMFIDPPYDTEFSDYEGRQFGKQDQERLAAFLKQTRARFLLIIKRTDFIEQLYRGSFEIMSFEDRYMYNVRSRNDRSTQHLLITNQPVPDLLG